MKNKLINIFLLAILILINCAQKHPVANRRNDPTFQIISVHCDTLLSEVGKAAISIGVIKNGKVYKIHKGGLINGQTPNDNTLYEIASITKTFTGTLLSKALLDKKVSLDEDIRKYLNVELPNLEYKRQPITLRHLVTHQSGLPYMFPNETSIFQNINFDELPTKINTLENGLTKEQFFEHLKNVKLDTLPGIKFTYSNVGANLVGYILESNYQMSFEELLNKEILQPLDMENTIINKKRIDINKVAVGQNDNNKIMPLRTEKNMNAEGGIVSALSDMIKYMSFHLDKNNAVALSSHQELWNGKYGDFEAGLFWQIFKDGDKPDKIFQNGGSFGTSSWITIIPELGIGVFVVTNRSGQNVHQKLNSTVDKIIDKIKQN